MRRRAKALPVTSEEIGLCGCWQILAVERMVLDATAPACEIACYVTSRTWEEMTP